MELHQWKGRVLIPISLLEIGRYLKAVDLPAGVALKRLVEYDADLLSNVCSMGLPRTRRKPGACLQVSFQLALIIRIANTSAAGGSLLEAAKLVRDRFSLFVDILENQLSPASQEYEVEMRRWKSW